MCVGSHVKYRYSCQTLMKLEFLDTFSQKDAQIPDIMKIRLVGAELFHADRQANLQTWRS